MKVLTSYSEEKAAYILSKGYYRIYVGNSIEAAECGGFDEEETRIIKQVTNLLCCDCKFTRLSKQIRMIHGRQERIPEWSKIS